MSDDGPDALSLRAYLALSGASIDWRSDLAAVMRSDAPLSRMLRTALADAFENESQQGPRLDLNNHKPNRDKFAGVVSRHEWMEIGKWIEARREQSPQGGDVVGEAAAHFGVGVKKAEKALTYYNKARFWVDAAMRSDAGQTIGREVVESLYHSIAVNPDMKRVNADLIHQLGLSH